MSIRDLIVGLAALQLRKTDAPHLAEAYRRYRHEGATDWVAHLTASGVLSGDDAREADTFTDQLLRACHANPATALEVLGGIEKAREVFQDTFAPPEIEGISFIQRGTTLLHLLERTQTPAERAALLPLFAEVCRIISAAHARGTIHRNLHPGTILVGHTQSVAVGDWSLGRVRGKHDALADALLQSITALREDRTKDSALAIVLDPRYLAPEFALGHIEDVDARSDVYALGAILYTLLTGKPPYAGNRGSDILHAVGSKKWEPVAAVQPAAPPELAAVCERAMHQEPSARYASARQFADELALALHAPAARTPERIAAPAWPYALLGACVMGIVTLVIAFLYAGAANKSAEAFRSLASLEQKCGQTEEERDRLARDLEEAERVRKDMETEREQSDQARAQLQESVKRSAEAQRKAEAELAKASASKPEPDTAAPPAGAPPAGAPPAEAPPAEPPADAHGPGTNPPEPPAAPPTPSANPPEKPAADANQHPPGLTQAEYAKDLPKLIAALTEEAAADGKKGVVVKPATDTVAEDLLLLGFKEGDMLVTINRITIESLAQARKTLETLKNDQGFNVRIVRGGQTSVMRVSVVDATPAPPPKPQKPAGGARKGGLTLITPSQTRALAADEAPEEAPAQSEEPPNDEK